MSEFMGLVHGVYDAKAEGFLPGGASLHNCMSAHGPDRATFERATSAELTPHKVEDSLAFMFETRLVIRPTRYALETYALQRDYDSCCAGLGADLRHRDGGDRHHHRDAGHDIAEPISAQKADHRERDGSPDTSTALRHAEARGARVVGNTSEVKICIELPA